MNGKDIFLGLKYVGSDLIEEAESARFPVQANQENTHRTIRRPLLIAAVIALVLLLVGCAVVYALRLQDMSIGKETYTQTFDEYGKYLEEPVEKTRDVLTLFGHSGDNIQKATAEWFAFLDTYDPDGERMDNNPDHEEIPNQYEHTYGCYTTDMAAKVDEIAAKYDLKLLEEGILFQAWQSEIFLEESGIQSLVLPDSGREMTRLSGMFYPPYNFDVDIALSADGLDHELWITVLYARKDYFPRDYPSGTDLSLYEQWDYTAPDGTSLLLALNNKGHGYVIAELENAMMILSVDGNYSTSAYPTEEEVMTREELETAASVFDYSIQPQILDRTPVEARLEASNKAHEAENAYVPETYSSFGEGLKSSIPIPEEKAQYAFYDLTGDGIDELLVDFSGEGAINEWYTIQDGEVRTCSGMSTYLCEGRVLETYFPDPERSDYARHWYHKAVSDTALMDMDSEAGGGIISILILKEGKWYQSTDFYGPEEEISQEEAQAVMDQYPRIQLDWHPAMDYPLSETQTLRDYLEAKDVRVSSEELKEIYKTYLERDTLHYSHYRILDINGDGVDDLLLKGEDDALSGSTDYYWLAFTYRYGHVREFGYNFYLCDDGVIERVDTRYGDIGVEIIGHQFQRWDGFEKEVLGFAAYNKATASWQGDWRNKVPMTEEEAASILAKYPRVDQGMRPISELLG